MNLKERIALRKSLSEQRFAPYLRETQGIFDDPRAQNEKAIELYIWSAQLAGLFHTQISYVEVAVRNALNRELSSWNASQPGCTKRWTRQRERHPNLGDIMDSHDIGRAVGLVKRSKVRTYHPTHDDVVAKLTLSFWVNLIKDSGQENQDRRRKFFWEQALHQAFPYAQENDEHGNLDLEKTRLLVADQLSSMLTLRNRVAHHDNLLQIRHLNHVHRMYALLGRVGGQDLVNSVDMSQVRAHIDKDPRLMWEGHEMAQDLAAYKQAKAEDDGTRVSLDDLA